MTGEENGSDMANLKVTISYIIKKLAWIDHEIPDILQHSFEYLNNSRHAEV